MDILLSLPIASYFFSTSLTSWSTSLNLLFFYMTWSTLVLSHSPLKIELLGVLGIRIVFWLVPSLFFLIFDCVLPSLAETIKFKGSSALPPRDATILSKLVGLALLNLCLESALQAGISLGLAHLLQTPVFRSSTTLPLPFQIIKHILLLFAAREFLTYFIHRYLLHGATTSNKPISSTLENLHLQYAHSRRAPPFALTLMTDHPVSFLLHRFVPMYLPAVILGCSRASGLHILTFLAFIILVTLEETLSMSGYTIVPGILLGGIARRNALHYCSAPGSRSSSGSSGNFGSWGILDWIHGTSLGKDVMSDVKDEAEKHHLRERGEKKADGMGGFVEEGISSLRRSARNRKSKAR
ncbi:hypothetical protein QBC37DRAFT_187598 [Rhypophila decipiens]|uniref:Fatty acid hydroxylase domain-containing protein n=1 Tax=Rhypophila decipiens TaxID=261697 RepID=A0AAN6Y7B6_9PEZI|nr:hypothetical protein QBC37DRAFT_187598 [Rhypophila decipiens]